MKQNPSRVLQLIRAGHFPTVMKVNLSDPRVIEIAGLCGVDAVWLDCEHVPNDWIGLENQIRAARVHKVDAIVRVSRGSYSDYVRPFEAGAAGIIVPHVRDAADARQIIEWVRFNPIGKRALDGGNVDGSFCLTPLDDYLHHSNTERIVILQIESPEALENVEKIASVPGFDALLFGPGDYSHRIGKPGQLGDPDVVAARQRVAHAARTHGKWTMTAGLIAPFADLVAEGHKLIGIGADVVALSTYLEQRLKVVRQATNELPEAIRPASPTVYG